MPSVATSGVASCAAFSIAWFKNSEVGNEEYKQAKIKGTHGEVFNSAREDIHDWYTDVLYPTEQDLGETKHYPFEAIMDVIEGMDKNDTLAGKMIFAMINEVTYNKNNFYWSKEFKRHGFKLVDVTYNQIGMNCYLFMRNNNRPKWAIQRGITIKDA